MSAQSTHLWYITFNKWLPRVLLRLELVTVKVTALLLTEAFVTLRTGLRMNDVG